jgi:TIR domain-containing protein/NACHT domain-containing protein
MAKLFISYSRKDSHTARKFIDAFESIDQDVWIDWEDLPPAVDWIQQILHAIEQSDIFIFFISPDSIVSEVCRVELGHASKNNKRIIPILLRDVDIKDAPEPIRKLSWVFIREHDDFNQGLARVKTAIETDWDWLEQHRRLQIRALEWERKKDVSLLLRGRDLENAEIMLASSVTKEPAPTELQRHYILQSRRNVNRNRNLIVALMSMFAIILSFLSIFAFGQAGQMQDLANQLSDVNTELAAADTQLAQTYNPPATVAITVEPQLNTPAATQAVLATASPEAPTEVSDSSLLEQATEKIKTDAVSQIMLGIISGIAVYIVAMLALLTRASRIGSTLFARSWLTKLATKPLLVMPGIGRWVLFIGYEQRLSKALKPYLRDEYFGVPALDPDGKNIFPGINSKGENLHNEIISKLGSQQPIFVLGNGGAGKTTLLAQLAHLIINKRIPSDIQRYIPVFVTPTYYDGDLLNAISVVLRERDGIALNKDTLQSQLEVGKYLILFDGISEIQGDQRKGLEEILSVAMNADFGKCRFVITSRPNISIPSGIQVFQLLSLSLEDINGLLSRENLERERKSRVLRQLEIFKSKPIEPMLFSMILEQSKDGEFNATLSALYESYVRRLLTHRSSYNSALEGDRELSLRGWSSIMEEFAHWFFIDSGNRGIGIRHEQLVDLIQSKGMLSEVLRYYQLKFEQESHVILELKDAGILEETRRWRFRHDTFEEYFAAKYIVSHLDEKRELPDLKEWTKDDAQIQSFSKVVDFMAEMIADDSHMRDLLLKSNLPSAWITLLRET